MNLGCGDHVIEGWTNVDYSLGARLTKVPLFRVVNRKLRIFTTDWDERVVIHDLTTRFPWSDSSVEVVYSSHTLEHFCKEDGRAFLDECHRVLRPGGIIRILVPDLHTCVVDYFGLAGIAPELIAGGGGECSPQVVTQFGKLGARQGWQRQSPLLVGVATPA